MRSRSGDLDKYIAVYSEHMPNVICENKITQKKRCNLKAIELNFRKSSTNYITRFLFLEFCLIYVWIKSIEKNAFIESL